MECDLCRVPTFVRLSRRTAAILKQNISLALGIKAVFLTLTLTGHATMWMAVFADMGASLLVVFALHFATLLIAESALSFLGIGAPLGVLRRLGAPLGAL